MERDVPAFTSRMRRWQYWAVLLYLPVHLFGLPFVLELAYARGRLSLGMANFWLYAVGAALLTALLLRFLRKEMDAAFDRPFFTLVEVVRSYAMIWVLEFFAELLLRAFGLEGDSANNEQAFALLRAERGPMIAATVLLAPIVEEVLFRGGIFGLLRHKSRALAYIVSTLAFCLYHVWSAVLLDARELLFVLQYLPASVMLARCYERTDSLWGSILLHALNNGVSLWIALEV